MNRQEFSAKVAEIAELTQVNDHQEARLQGCRLVQQFDPGALKETVNKLLQVQQIQNSMGHMVPIISQISYECYQEMLAAARRHFGKDSDMFDEFYHAF